MMMFSRPTSRSHCSSSQGNSGVSGTEAQSFRVNDCQNEAQ